MKERLSGDSTFLLKINPTKIVWYINRSLWICQGVWKEGWGVEENQVFGALNRLERVIERIKKRAYIFNCSYQTAWDNYLADGEKEGFSKEYIFGE